ncbi:tether containing UBX domain for GLUT4 isoform X2 [Orussus abietinus]|uniref:tether containing UBX domain for GLUT4 isoform X2 n=1 Tax=Orussus abietinus TaxID=222816 RepID=UPI0006253735|nr:tether containing UBX domain for GLUT4 isoform X2 [Orussus abietinus]
MAANKSVTVLTPNGRRQNVRVTPDTTILQVIEEVCQKHGFNSEEYDAKHYNRILDADTSFRFTGLSNNAQLEMVLRSKPRSVSNVTLCIQLENGERVTGQFSPGISLNQILKELCLDQTLDTAILVYTHREIYGQELDKTTLRLLGLNRGRAMMRLIHRHPDQLKTQANVCTPLHRKSSEVNHSTTENVQANVATSQSTGRSVEPAQNTVHENQLTVSSQDVAQEKIEEPGPVIQPVQDVETSSSTNPVISTVGDADQSYLPATEDMEIGNAKFLGERNALVFNQADARAIPHDELPSSFFELTVDDVRLLWRDAKRRREELEETPLAISAHRQLQEDKNTLNQLNKYRRTVIRIQFPNQMVLQGLFGPLETIQAIIDFVKIYLSDPDSEFVLYTTPPKKVLSPSSRLIEEHLVPSAIIHYSGQSDLKTEVKMKLTDPATASIQAIKSKMELERKSPSTSNDSSEIMSDAKETNGSSTAMQEPAPGPSTTSVPSRPARQSKTEVPKWFRGPSAR